MYWRPSPPSAPLALCLSVILPVLVLLVETSLARRQHHTQEGRNRTIWARNELISERDNEFVSKGKICIGTNGRMSVPSNKVHHYRNLKERYTNCTYVDGNLEITWLLDENLDLSFLQYIREVTGYVLISHVDIKRVVLPRLQIIRGRTFFKLNTMEDQPFALLVTHCKMYTLELPALRDVLSGNIGMLRNYNLCHVKTIDWNEIISDPEGSYHYVYNFTTPERECPQCHESCKKGCWGEGEGNCQKFSKEYCSPQCSGGRCYGPNPRECCHQFCAGGCHGPTDSDCIACKNFYNDGVCTRDCPPMQVYNPITYSWEPNPNGKYAYGATCVKNCPEHLLKDNGACVRTCPQNKRAVNGECVNCNGTCPKSCPGAPLIHSGNIDSFKDCTVIEGNIQILDNSFKGFQQIYDNYTFGDRYPPMHPDRLEVFSTLKEVTGFINIQGYHVDFKNLSYFRNLEVIDGRDVHEFHTSLYIVKTSLESLNLRSLRRINAGSVGILENKYLCFAKDINWSRILQKSKDQTLMLSNNSDPKNCKERGLVCDEQCSKDGCWAPGNDQCLNCTNYRMENTCLQSCSVMPGLYKSENFECKPCDEQCDSNCSGPGPDKCVSCRHVKDGPYCVSKCPTNKYNDNGVCRTCHPNCVDGCSGPKNTIGPGGCYSCNKAILYENATTYVCLQKNESCPDGYYYEWIRLQEQEFLKPLAGKAICRKCHPRCKKCTAYGFHIMQCQQCTHYRKGEQCEDECPSDHYPNDVTQECLPCDEECKGCIGPGPENCLACHGSKVYDSGNWEGNSSFRCAAICPPEFPRRVFRDNSTESYCTDSPSQVMSPLGAPNTTVTVIIIVSAIGLIVTVSMITAICYWCKRVKVKEDALKMTLTLTGLEDEPLRSTTVQPNVAQLRIIKETEMRRGSILGYGAFGTVYKGVWVPEGENTKIPVAIKVLREDTGVNTSKEFLGEAYIMASVDHPNLLQLLAVCMTSQMMLVTQLMPLGCLLDFVRKNNDRIGSKRLLNWCAQIARGMAYLEEKRLVHRDLAARNILVQTPALVKITDFGLAKLLDINEEEYKAEGGKMPIKWLALECIQHRIFTHKSDVWAFGVTVWELLTFGGKPYEDIPAREVPERIERGMRLEQPKICTIDVFQVMVKCWWLDAGMRPSFKELADDFTNFSRDPGRYLVIENRNKTKQDNRDVARTITSSLETADLQSEMDEFMQPKSRAPIPLSVSVSPPPTPMKFWPSASQMTSDGSCAPQNQHNWNQERLRYARSQVDPSCSMKTTTTSDGSSLKGDLVGSDEYDTGRQQAQVGNLKLELPVDEDDYLMPSPQQSQAGTTYVDLIDSKESSGSNPSLYRNYADFYKMNIDNPEYLMGSEQPPSQTLGIPTVSELVHSGSENSGLTQPYPQRSSEEESDHEYYNDFDRLQRELQPLRKGGETTV